MNSFTFYNFTDTQHRMLETSLSQQLLVISNSIQRTTNLPLLQELYSKEAALKTLLIQLRPN